MSRQLLTFRNKEGKFLRREWARLEDLRMAWVFEVKDGEVILMGLTDYWKEAR